MRQPIAWRGGALDAATLPLAPQALFIADEAWRLAVPPTQSIDSTVCYRPTVKAVRHATVFAVADVDLEVVPEQSQCWVSARARSDKGKEVSRLLPGQGRRQGRPSSICSPAASSGKRQVPRAAEKKKKGASLRTYLKGIDSDRLLEHAEVNLNVPQY